MRARPSLPALLWTLAWVVLAEALLRRFVPHPAWTAWAVLAAIGAWAGTLPLRMDGASGWVRALLGALVLPAGAFLLGRALDGAGVQGHAPGWTFLLPWALLLVLALAGPASLARVLRIAGVEWTRTWRSLVFRLALLATAAVTIAAGFAYVHVKGSTGWSQASEALQSGLLAAEVFLLVLGATAIAGEATAGTLKMMVPHAYRRSEWVLGKVLVLLVVSVLLVLLAGTLATAHAHLGPGLGDVVQEPVPGLEYLPREVLTGAGEMQGHLLEVGMAGLAAAVTTALLGLLFSAFFDTVVGALCCAFLLFVAVRFADVLLRLPREALDGIYAWHPREMAHLLDELGRGFSQRWDPDRVGVSLALALVTGALALLVAVRAFSRRDLHA